jgi:XisH protein
MPAKDSYHEIVKNALIEEGWTVTHDPFFIRIGKRKGFIDLAAEIIAAERGQQKIAVEIKSFTGLSDLDQFEDALGQFNVYDFTLKRKEPDRQLWIALPLGFYESFLRILFFLKWQHTIK